MGIENHTFTDSDVRIDTSKISDFGIDFENKCKNIWLQKIDAIAIAKHFKLTAEDINCPMLKAKQDELNEADVRHFDEIAELKSKISELEKRLKNIKWKVC